MARSSRALPIAGFVLALVGLALLVVQVVRAINGSALGTLGVILLWVGVGLLAVAVALLTTSLLSTSDETADDKPARRAADSEGAAPA